MKDKEMLIILFASVFLMLLPIDDKMDSMSRASRFVFATLLVYFTIRILVIKI